MVDKVKYEEYKNSLLNAARLTAKKNSVLISFNLKDGVCECLVSMIQQDGTKDVLMRDSFLGDANFYRDFLEPFVKEYYKNMVVAFNDNIDMNADGKYTYRIVTDDNDMMSVDGITLEYANRLALISANANSGGSLKNDDRGEITLITAVVLVFGIAVSFIVMSLLIS